jgi:hypothetical protein
MRALVASYILVLIGAALWVTGSILVAFPAHFLVLDYDAIFEEFLTKPQHPLTVLILLVIDLSIAIFMLKDFRTRDGLAAGRRLGVVLLAILSFVISAMFLPLFNAQVVKNHTFVVALFALGPILLVRAMSYAPPQRARRIPREFEDHLGQGNVE